MEVSMEWSSSDKDKYFSHRMYKTWQNDGALKVYYQEFNLANIFECLLF